MTGEKTRPGKSWRLLIWLICLLLIVLAGSSIFFYIANIEGQKEGPSSTLHASVTHITATPTTKTPAASPTATSSLTPSVTSTPQPLFSDYFVDNTKGWLTGNASGYTRVIDEGGLSLSATNHKILIESLPANNSFDDFQLTTIFTMQEGDENDSVGVYVRGDSNLDHDYRIDIYGNDTYIISKESLDTNNSPVITPLTHATRTSLLKSPGQANMLTVIMKGPTLVLMVNGSVVKSITDPDYTHGQIALFVQHGYTSSGVEVVFSSIVVYPAPDELPES